MHFYQSLIIHSIHQYEFDVYIYIYAAMMSIMQGTFIKSIYKVYPFNLSTMNLISKMKLKQRSELIYRAVYGKQHPGKHVIDVYIICLTPNIYILITYMKSVYIVSCTYSNNGTVWPTHYMHAHIKYEHIQICVDVMHKYA